ncbi:MAG: succinate dehydrogenase cytochrome b subunit [Prevotellaceae bacterium]|jgi:succinate dehydrogenase / fumarate reductase cytochrome b subunit|nr:succinate dehydrogenase cytochrome b subunit [Prevotellaceae bacterium]
MANIFSSSIGKKFVMSISGAFLLVFLLLHASINLAAVASEEAYNMACHFMDTNILIQIMVPVLALGFVVHIVYAIILTLHNMKARPVKYAVGNQAEATFASRNMFVLGLIVLGFLTIHLSHFWAKMQLQHFVGGTATENPYLLVKTTLSNPANAIMYLVWIWALWFHLSHGFWSAFQTLGASNQIWIPRLKVASYIYATIIAVSFTIVPLYFVLFAK